MFFIYKGNTNSIYSGIVINVYFTFCITFDLNVFHNN